MMIAIGVVVAVIIIIIVGKLSSWLQDDNDIVADDAWHPLLLLLGYRHHLHDFDLFFTLLAAALC